VVKQDLIAGAMRDLRRHWLGLEMEMQAIKADRSQDARLLDLYGQSKDTDLDIAYWASQWNAAMGEPSW
jgi:hypothetical protein